MSTVAETIITISAVIGAIGVIWGVIYGVIKWVQRQNQQTDDIKSLKELHTSDVEAMQKKEREDMQDIKNELCVLSYAMLASLDGLKQLHCNGEVTKAHKRLEKHLNQSAHDQI